MDKKWGDLPVIPDTDSGIAALEREQMTKPRPMEVEGPPLHQPSSKLFPPTNQTHPAEHYAVDTVTLHTIQLLQHARKVRAMINNVQHIIDSAKQEGDTLEFPEAPPIPVFKRRETANKFQTPLPFLPKKPESEFVQGIGRAPPEIDNASCRKMLRQSVATLCAHTGYDNCTESVLETLTDSCHEYLLGMTKTMRHAVDAEARLGATPFQDVMEQVFQEIGLGSMTVLHEFYQTRILKYHEHMFETCQSLLHEYEKCKNPELRSADEKISKLKEDSLSEIHFPTTDDIDEILDGDQVLRMEGGLGLDMSMAQEASGCEDSEQAQQKQDTQEQQKASASSVEMYDQQETPSGSEMPNTPNISSDTGDSIQDPPSVPLSDMASPPSISFKPTGPPHKKLKI